MRIYCLQLSKELFSDSLRRLLRLLQYKLQQSRVGVKEPYLSLLIIFKGILENPVTSWRFVHDSFGII